MNLPGPDSGSLPDSGHAEEKPENPPLSSTFVPAASAKPGERPPDLIGAGRYTIVRMIAWGGMGVVYEANDRLLDRRVALKKIHPHLAPSAEITERFRREALAAAQLDHPNIVPIYDTGEDDAQPFIAMALIDGGSLGAWVRGHGPLSPEETVRLLIPIAEAVGYAHQRGFVHRDLKPDNVLIDPQGRPRVTDFGLARRLVQPGNLTGVGQPLGTPRYMAPEQVRPTPAGTGPAADIYALGGLLLYLLTGRPPFDGEEVADILVKVIQTPPELPRDINPNLPESLNEICRKCLQKEPPDRYSTAEAVADALRLALVPESMHEAIVRPPQGLSPAAVLALPSFHYGSVVPPDYFIDREEELEEAARLVRSGQGFLLVGNRRSGKTSFCTKLIHEVMGRSGNDILAVYLNLQQCSRLTPETFLEHTLLSVVGEMARQVFRCKYSDLLRPNPAEENERLRSDHDFVAFADLFARIRERTHSRHGADPSPLMATEFIQFTQDLLHILRAKDWKRCAMFYDEANLLPAGISVDLLTSNEEALSAAGVTSIYAASPEMEQTFVQLGDVLGHHLRLGPFRSPDDMRRLLVRYCGSDLPAEPETLARLWELSQGRPYVIQLLAGGSFRLARDERSLVVLARHVEAAHDAVSRDKPHLFG